MKKTFPAVAGLICLGAFTGTVYGEESLFSRQNALTQRFTALAKDVNVQRETLTSVEARVSAAAKNLAPVMRVCMQTGAALQPGDVDSAEKNAAAVEAQLKDALTVARACKSPETLKAARAALTDAIDQTAAIERLTYTGAVSPDELGGVQSKIPESLTALAELSAAWNDARADYKSFDARVQAHQHDAADFNARREVKKGDAGAAATFPLEGLRAQFDTLEKSVAKLSTARGQLEGCRHASSSTVPGALSARIESARKNAAQAFAVYGQDITKDSAACQTRLEAKAAPGDAVKLAEASGLSQVAPAEPPPPKASPVTPVASETLPLIPGTKEKQKRPRKNEAKKKTPPTMTASAPQGVTVAAMSGFATTEEGSNSFGLGEGQTVAIGAGIETKPSSKVRLGGGAQTVDIGADTRVRMPSAASRLMKLESGSVDLKNDPAATRLSGEPDLDGIETTQGVIAAQGRGAGARYRVTADQGQTAVEVFEGRVHVAGTYVLKLPPVGEQSNAQKLSQTPVEDLDLGPGERAILLRVRQPATVVAAAFEAPVVIEQTLPRKTAKPGDVGKAIKTEAPKQMAAAEPSPKAPVKAEIKAKDRKKEKAAPVNAAAKTEIAKAIPAAVPAGPRLPGFLSARPQDVGAVASAVAPAMPAWAAPERSVDPVEEARTQLERQRKLDSERRTAELRQAEERDVQRRHLEQESAEQEQERQVAEQRRAEEDNGLMQNARTLPSQTSPSQPVLPQEGRAPENLNRESPNNVYGQALPRVARADFAGTWRCRVAPTQRRYGTMQSQIVIRATARGYEAVADGQRIPAVSARGSRIHFSQSVSSASNDGRYYSSGIDLDLQDQGMSLAGSGRVKISDGYSIQETPAALFCARLN